MTTIATPDADSAARQDLLERYARLAIRVGINLEPGREVAIRAMIEHAPLVHALVKAGYEAGARRIEVDYEDLEVLRSQIALPPEEAVGTVPRWTFERVDDVRAQRRAQVFVIGFPPDMFDGLGQPPSGPSNYPRSRYPTVSDLILDLALNRNVRRGRREGRSPIGDDAEPLPMRRPSRFFESGWRSTSASKWVRTRPRSIRAR
jgi:Thermophilic metalloprotease (M29)